MRLQVFVCTLAIGPLAATSALAQAGGCAEPPASPLVVNVKDKGAKGDGRTDDSGASIVMPNANTDVTLPVLGRYDIAQALRLQDD